MIVCGFFLILIFSLIVLFSIRYHRSRHPVSTPIRGHKGLEITWTLIPVFVTMTFFAWGVSLYFRHFRPPADALEIFVVGKQWMWKLQHPSGPREINELHIPVDQPVMLTLTSEDVIHSFYVPALRVKMDAVPGRYSRIWFEANKTGKYRFFCAEYCGTEHSRMIGWLHVMKPEDYRRWVMERASGAKVAVDERALAASEAPAEEGRRLFEKYRCFVCHNPQSGGLGPDLTGVFGKSVELSNGQSVPADADYLRESIAQPMAKIVRGYTPLMPAFDRLLSEPQIHSVVEYLKTLSPETSGDTPAGASP
jgi:cytochrome c oxidase subunit 2